PIVKWTISSFMFSLKNDFYKWFLLQDVTCSMINDLIRLVSEYDYGVAYAVHKTVGLSASHYCIDFVRFCIDKNDTQLALHVLERIATSLHLYELEDLLVHSVRGIATEITHYILDHFHITNEHLRYVLNQAMYSRDTECFEYLASK